MPDLCDDLPRGGNLSSKIPLWPSHCRRVIFVTPRFPDLGGLTTFIENLSVPLRDAGVTAEVISVEPGDRPSTIPTTVALTRPNLHRGPLLRGHGNTLARLWIFPIVLFKRLSFSRYRCRLEALTDDAVVIFTNILPKIFLDEAGFQRFLGGPIFVGQYHSSFASTTGQDGAWVAPLLKMHYRNVDVLTVLTDEDAELFADFVPTPCRAVPNPIPIPIRSSFHIPREAVAVALARLDSAKQLDLMIDLFLEATKDPRLAHWRLHIYGDGPERKQLESRVDQHNAWARVSLTGRTDDVPSVLDSASLNLLTCKYEGLPMSIMEASAAAVPTVAFQCSPGVRDLVTEA